MTVMFEQSVPFGATNPILSLNYVGSYVKLASLFAAIFVVNRL